MSTPIEKFCDKIENALKSTIIGFENGIQAAIIINSAIKRAGGMKDVIIDSFDNVWKKIEI